MNQANYDSDLLDEEDDSRPRSALMLPEDLLPLSKRTRQALGVFMERAAVLLAQRSMQSPDEHLVRDTRHLVDCAAKMARINLKWYTRFDDEIHYQDSGPNAGEIAKAIIAAEPGFEEFIDYKQWRKMGKTPSEIAALMDRIEASIAKPAPQSENKPPATGQQNSPW